MAAHPAPTPLNVSTQTAWDAHCAWFSKRSRITNLRIATWRVLKQHHLSRTSQNACFFNAFSAVTGSCLFSLIMREILWPSGAHVKESLFSPQPSVVLQMREKRTTLGPLPLLKSFPFSLTITDGRPEASGSAIPLQTRNLQPSYDCTKQGKINKSGLSAFSVTSTMKLLGQEPNQNAAVLAKISFLSMLTFPPGQIPSVSLPGEGTNP